MLKPAERDAIVKAVVQLVATHQVHAATQPRSIERLRECTRREQAQEAATARFLALLDSYTEQTA